MNNLQIGSYVRQKRESLRISQEAVAYALQISQAAYSKIERNETKLKVDQLYKIAEYLGISIYELLPPSVASDVAGESLFGLVKHLATISYNKVVHRIKRL